MWPLNLKKTTLEYSIIKWTMTFARSSSSQTENGRSLHCLRSHSISLTRETLLPCRLTLLFFSRTSPLILPLPPHHLASPYYCRHFTLSAALFSDVIPLVLLDQGCHSLPPSLTWVPSLCLFDILSSCRLAPSPSYLPVILPLLMSSPVSPFSQSLSSLFLLYCPSFSGIGWKNSSAAPWQTVNCMLHIRFSGGADLLETPLL